MTNTQYLLGWIIYLIGATGCIASFQLVIKKLPSRITRVLCIGTATLLYMPWKLTPEQHWLAPAFLTSLYNRLGQAPEAINTAEFVLIVAVASSITLALFIPIKGRSKSPENNTIVETTKCSPTQDRREPSL